MHRETTLGFILTDGTVRWEITMGFILTDGTVRWEITLGFILTDGTVRWEITLRIISLIEMRPGVNGGDIVYTESLIVPPTPISSRRSVYTEVLIR